MSAITSVTYVVNRLSATSTYAWYGPNQDNPQSSGDYSAKLARYSTEGDTGISIQVHTFSSLDGGHSGTWTMSSSAPIPY